jgi:hypothetical protein
MTHIIRRKKMEGEATTFSPQGTRRILSLPDACAGIVPMFSVGGPGCEDCAYAWHDHKSQGCLKAKADTAEAVIMGEGKCCDEPQRSGRLNMPNMLGTASTGLPKNTNI